MASNGHVPSVSVSHASTNDSSGKNLESFTTFPRSSSALCDSSPEGRECVTVGPPKQTTTNITSIPTPPSQPTQPPTTLGYTTLANVDQTNTQPPSKRPRGRPVGAKNKPKSSIVTKNESENHLKRITIEIPSGNDVIATLVNFARNRQANITILDAFGTVSDIPILRPQTHNNLVFPYRRVYNIISLNGTYMYSHFPSSSTTASNLPYRNNFMIYFSTAEGSIYGGFVAGKLIASSVVVVTVELFKNLEHHRASFIDGNIQVDEVGEHSSTVINHHSNGSISMGVGKNNTLVNSDMPAYAVIANGSSNPLNSEPSPQPPTRGDMNALKLNHSTQLNG